MASFLTPWGAEHLADYDGATLGWLIVDEDGATAAARTMAYVEDAIGSGGEDEIQTDDAPGYARGTIDTLIAYDDDTVNLERDPSSNPSTSTLGAEPRGLWLYDPDTGTDDTDRRLVAFLAYAEEGSGTDDWTIDSIVLATAAPDQLTADVPLDYNPTTQHLTLAYGEGLDVIDGELVATGDSGGGGAGYLQAPTVIDVSDVTPGALPGQQPDEVEVDLSDLDLDVRVVSIVLPDTEAADVTAVLTMPTTPGHQPIIVTASPPNRDAQTAIKIRNPVFGAISIAGGIAVETVAAHLYEINVEGLDVAGYLGSNYMWSGAPLFTTTTGDEYGILYPPASDDHVDAVVAWAESEYGITVDSGVVASIKATLTEYLASDGNQPVNVNFAAYKAGLAVEAVLAMVMDLYASGGGGGVPTSRTIAGVDLADDITASELRAALASTLDPWRVEIICWTGWSDSSGASRLVDSSSLGGGHAQLTNALGNYVEWKPRLSPGTWTFYFVHRQVSSSGVGTVSIDGTDIGTVNHYAASTARNVVSTLSGVTVTGYGPHALRVRNTAIGTGGGGYTTEWQSILAVRTA